MKNYLHLSPLAKAFFLAILLFLGCFNNSVAQRKSKGVLPADKIEGLQASEGSNFVSVLQPKVKFRKNIFERLRETFSKKKEAEEGEEDEDDMRTDRPDLAAEQEFRLTRDPKLGYVPTERLKIVRDRMRQQRAQNLQSAFVQALPSAQNWTERGPSNIGGRTRALMFDPNDATKKKVWAGGAGGGLWYTNDITVASPSWINVGDVWANMAISCIAYNPANTQEYYAGTGEGWYNGDAIRGAGIWKTTDGGSTWTQLSAIATDINFDYVQKIVVTSNGTVFAATRSRYCNRGGVYKSTNGGTSWTLSFGTQGTSCSNSNSSAADLELGSDGTIYATLGIFSLGGIYKSTDVGATWTQLNTGSNGFPTTGFYRIELAVAPSDPNRLYAMAHNSSTNALLNIYTSANKGSTWTTCTLPSWVDQSCSSPSTDMTRTQAWYDLIMAVDPNTPSTLIVGGVDLLKSTDSGTTWTQISSWAGACSRQYVHADQHAIVYQPGSSTMAIFGNDGGVFYSANANATIPTISGKNSGYNVTQYYACAIHPTAGQNYYLAGAQDNGTHILNAPGINVASTATGGDGAYCFIDQTNPSYQISSYVYNNFYLTTNNWATTRSLSSSSTGDFINPADYDDTNHILYSSYSTTQLQRVSGITGTPASPVQITITGMTSKAGNIRISPYAPTGTTTLFVGTQNSKLFKVTNAHSTPTVTDISSAAFPAGASISCVEIGATENDLLVTFYNYGVISVWRTTDGGVTWLNKEGNLPDMPIRWALYNPNNRNEVLLATELGVWSTSDITAPSPSWIADNSMANVRVDMLQIRSSDKQVVAATHGRGLFTASINCESPVIVTAPTGPTATCTGVGIQTLSVSATGTSLTYSWRKAGVTLTDGGVVSGSATATLTLTNPTTADAGSYDVVVTNLNCASLTPAAVSVTVNPAPSITIATTSSAVYTSASGQTSTLAYSATTGSPTTYSIVWNATPVNNFANVTNSGLPASPINIGVPGNTASGTYTGSLTVKNINGCTSSTGNFTFTVNDVPTITTGTVSTSICAGTAVSVPFFITSTFVAGNVFTAQLSDAVGSFVSPVTIGTLTSATAGTISALIPSGTTPGNAYQIRVVSSTPAVTGIQNSATITINSAPSANAGSAIAVCQSASPSAISLSGASIGGIATMGTWSITTGTGTLSSTAATANPAAITYTPAANATGTVVLTLTTDGGAGCPAATSTKIITINATPTAVAGNAMNTCQSTSPTAITLSGASVGGSATTGAWSIATGGGALSSLAQSTNPAAVTYTPAANATGAVTLTLTTNAGIGCSAVTASKTITINVTPSITAAATATAVYASASSQTTTLSYSATSGSPSTYSIAWNSSPANSFAAVNNAALVLSPLSITIPANTAVGVYTGTLTVKTVDGCTSASTSFTLMVNAVPTIATGTIAATICAGSTISVPYTITGTFSAGNAFIAQLSNATGSFTTPTAIGTLSSILAGTISTIIPANTASGTAYRIRVISTTPAVVGAQNATAIAINAIPSAIAGGPNTVCQSSTSTAITLSGASVGGSAITGAWSITSGGGTLSSTLQTAIPGNVRYTPATNASGTITLTLTSNAGAGCTTATATRTINIIPLPTITTATTAAAVCVNSSSQTTTLSYSATTSSPTTYSITWNATPTNSFVAVLNAALPNSIIPITVPSNTLAGNYTGTITVKNANGCGSSSKTFTLRVNALPNVTLSTSTTAVCASASAQTAPLTYSASTGTPTTYSIVWTATPSNSFSAVTNATLTTSPIGITVPANTAPGTYTGTLTVKNANGCVSTAKNFTVPVNALPTITPAATATSLCASTSAQTSSLTYSATTGTPTTYSIAWNAAPTNSFVAVNNATLLANAISFTVPANTAADTYTGTLTVRNANSCTSLGTTFTITINPLPSITAATAAVGACLSSSSQVAVLNYSATTNSPITYGITWNATPNNSFSTVSNATLLANTINITVPANAALGTYTGNLTVRNANGCASTVKTFTLPVNALPTITSAATAAAVCASASAQTTPLTYSASTGTPTTYSIIWTATPSNSFSTVTNATLTTSPISITVPANTAPGTYTGTLRVKNANGCESAAKTFTLVVNPLISITSAAATSDVNASSSVQTTPLTYSATTGTPTTFSIGWNASPVNGFVNVTNAALPLSPINITVPANTAGGTYIGNLTVKNAGGCISAASAFSVTVIGLAAIASNSKGDVGNYTGFSLNNGNPPISLDHAELLQNVPNPFNDQTQIGFYLPTASDGHLTIRDEKGSIIYRLKTSYNQGWNQVTIKNSELKAIGVLYYTLDTPEYTATKKMVLFNR
jgi:hypothetical protein